jgi:hypothetical protein
MTRAALVYHAVAVVVLAIADLVGRFDLSLA